MTAPSSVSALIELFKNVAIQDGGLMEYDGTYAPNGIQYHWNSGLSGYSYTQSKDIGTITTGTGDVNGVVEYKKAIDDMYSSPYQASEYPVLVARAKALSDNAEWKLLAIGGTGGTTVLGESDYLSNTTFETHYCTLSSGSINRLSLHSRTTDGNEATVLWEYVVLSSTYPTTLCPTDIDIDRRVTTGWSDARLTVDYDGSPTVSINDHIKIYLDKNTVTTFDKCIFGGKVREYGYIHSGADARWLEITCADYSAFLYDTVDRGSQLGLSDSILLAIVTPVMSYGELVGCTLNIESHTIETRYTEGNTTGKIISDICNQQKNIIDADWRVTPGGVFEAFTVGSKSTTINVANDCLEFNYHVDSNDIINTIEVLGAFKNTIGVDANFTEDTVNWSGGGSVVAIGRTGHKTASGSYKLYTQSNTGEDMWLERTFSTTLNCSEPYLLKLSYDYLHAAPTTTTGSIDFTLYFLNDDDNYYYINIKQGGLKEFSGWDYDLPTGDRTAMAMTDYGLFTDGWADLEILFGDIGEYGHVGSPIWSNITKMKLEVISPTGGYGSWFAIDNMEIKGYYNGVYGDTISQNSYGVRTGVPLLDTELLTYDACTIMASLIVTGYKDPKILIEDLETLKNFEIEEGEQAVFNTIGINETVTVRSIEHRVRGFEVRTNMNLSNRFIPTTEDILAKLNRDMARVNWDTARYMAKQAFAFGVAPVRSGMIDYASTDMGLSNFLWAEGSKFLLEGAEWDAIAFIGADGAGNATYDINMGSIYVTSGSLNVNDESWLTPSPYDDPPVIFNTDNTIVMGADIRVSSTASVAYHIFCGNKSDYVASAYGFGFYIGNDGVIGESYNGSANRSTTSVFATINANQSYNMILAYYPDDRIDFIVGGELKGSITTNLPSTPSYIGIFTFGARTYENVNKILTLHNFKVGEYK